MKLPTSTRRRFLQLSGASALALAAGLPGPGGSALAQATSGGALKMSVTIRPYTLNPLKGIGTTDYIVSEMLYEGLTKITRDLTAEPRLAESWTANEDSTEFTFKLRPDVTFKNGDPLTAADVVATFEAILDPETASPARFVIGPIESVTAVDDLTVRFDLRAPYVDLPLAVAHNNARIVPASVLENDPALLDTEDHGSGPFSLVRYDPSQIIQFERNPDYFLEGRPYLDTVDLVLYPDPVAEVGGLLNGATDIMLTVSPPQYRQLETEESVTLLPGVWHAFWGEGGDVLIGEVSTVNDDETDNWFREPIGRFAAIEEDVAPTHLLVSDYATWLK